MFTASERQTKLISDFLTGDDGQPRPDVIVSTGMGLGEVIAKGGWVIRQELNGKKAETIIRMMEHTGVATETSAGAMADHATQSTPHIHLATAIDVIQEIQVDQSDEGNIRVGFLTGNIRPNFQAFKLHHGTNDVPLWHDTFTELELAAKEFNHCSIGAERLKLKVAFLQKLLNRPDTSFGQSLLIPGTVLFTGVPERVAQITSARVGADWALVQEAVPSRFGGTSPEYFIRAKGDYDPAKQNADGQMLAGFPVHQTWHSQHIHVKWDELTRPKLSVGGPNGDEVIVTFDRTVRSGFKGQSRKTDTHLQLFATRGMIPDEINSLLARHSGYLINARN